MAKQGEETDFRLATSVTHLLHRAQQVAVNLSADALAEAGLTIRQFAVLAALNDQDGQSQSSLVDITGIDRSTLADMVARMEKSGMIKRVRAENDARAKAVSLTKAGRESFEQAAPLVSAADTELLEELRKSRKESLLLSLAIVAGDYEEDEPIKKRKKKKKKKKK